MIGLVASVVLSAAAPGSDAVLATNATPAELVASCRAMVPETVEIEGRIILRNRRGIVQAEHGYVLSRSNSVTRLAIDGKAIDPPASPGHRSPSLLGTDVTWSDLTLEYLWWEDFSCDSERTMESVHGQECLVVLMRKDSRTVRVWVDRKTGAMMQAEELVDGQAVRRLWGTRIKKFDERWAPNVLEVETVGSGHRTKITVEKLK